MQIGAGMITEKVHSIVTRASHYTTLTTFFGICLCGMGMFSTSVAIEQYLQKGNREDIIEQRYYVTNSVFVSIYSVTALLLLIYMYHESGLWWEKSPFAKKMSPFAKKMRVAAIELMSDTHL